MYFVTICTKERYHFFGEICEGKMILSEIGKICDQEIYKTEILRPYVDMHASVVMPNHIHLLMYVDASSEGIETNDMATHGVGTHGNASTTNDTNTNPTNKDRLLSVPTNPIVTL